jgi:hypothetical protein
MNKARQVAMSTFGQAMVVEKAVVGAKQAFRAKTFPTAVV